MSAILPVGGMTATTAGRFGLARSRSSSDVPASSMPASSGDRQIAGKDEAESDLAFDVAPAAIDHARLAEWAERIRTAERASAPLVERPAPDGERPAYPTAVAAYRELSDLIDAL
jgi:hypothetical protein